MFKKFICCLKSNNPIDKNTIPEKSIEEICVRVTEDIIPKSVFDTCSLYDSSEWLKKSSINWKDTIPFVPPIEKGICIKVYDGDTITIASKLPYPSSPLYRFSVRLNGIDCPEIKGKDIHEKECAQIAKNELSNLILNKVVLLKNINTEKYGRILADVYIDNINLNEYMIEKRLAVLYDGGTKISPSNWMDYYLKGDL
jgi:endonuclease YncB( thermonuclease family)